MENSHWAARSKYKSTSLPKVHKWRTLTEQLDLSISQLPLPKVHKWRTLTKQLDLSIPLNIDEVCNSDDQSAKINRPHTFPGLVLWCWTLLFNNISAISWQSVLLVEETGVPEENHRPVASHWQTLSHNVVSSTSCHVNRVRTHNFNGDKHWLHR